MSFAVLFLFLFYWPAIAFEGVYHSENEQCDFKYSVDKQLAREQIYGFTIDCIADKVISLESYGTTAIN